jgi:hypothetical protein
MRALIAGVLALVVAAPAAAGGSKPADFSSSAAVLQWISTYRTAPKVSDVPKAVLALSRTGAFDDPEHCGVYVGFIAGVLNTNPAQADALIGKMMTMRERDRWIIVRAIAYSGLPQWKDLLRQTVARMPRYDAMSEKFIDGKSATLAQFTIPPDQTTLDRLRDHLRLDKPVKDVALEPSPDVLDLLWGYYFATASYGPIMHIVAMLPWSREHDDAERLSIGQMAKYTLARNAAHDEVLLSMLKASIKARSQEPVTAAALKEIVEAAETVDTAKIHKDALAAIEELRQKGPAYKRNVSWWGYVGQTAIAGGCVAAAVMGAVALGIPCVVGGAASSAALSFWNNQP